MWCSSRTGPRPVRNHRRSSFSLLCEEAAENSGRNEQMLNAIRCAELNCIRYRGTDPAIFTRISASGELDVCDLEPPPGTELGFRTHVTFRVTKPNTPRISVLMRQFKQYLKAQIDSYRKLMDSHPVSRHRLSWLGVSMYRLRFRWWTPRNTMTFLYPPFWQTVRFEILQSDSRTIHISSTPAHHYLIANWLKTLPDTQDVRWYTEEGWSTTGVWHSSYC